MSDDKCTTDRRHRGHTPDDRQSPQCSSRPTSATSEVVFYSLFVVILIMLAFILSAAARETWKWLSSLASTLLS